MSELSRHEYWAEVENIAKSVTEEARDEEREIGEVLHDYVDSHQWVIYYAYNMQVLQLSDHENEMWEQGLQPTKVDSIWNILTPAAFCALYADVANHEAYDAEPEDDAEEDEEDF